MVLIRPIRTADYALWLSLWNANNQGHSDPAVTAATWRRLTDKESAVRGLGAFTENDEMAGLLHYILHPVTGHIAPVCYMQDVFVTPSFRRKGLARALLEDLAATGKEEGWARIYWLAEADNAAAQALYRKIGVKLDFTFHVLPL